MIKSKEFKQMLDKTSALIPDLLAASTTKQEEVAALVALLTIRLGLLEDLAEEITHPDFEENFRVMRESIFEVVQMINERV